MTFNGEAQVPEPVEQAVNSFKEQAGKSPELAREAFWRLLDNAKDCQKRFNRALILMAIFALVFELLNRQLVSEASVGGLKLAKLDSLLFVLPIAIGFEVFHGASALRDRAVMQSAYSRVSEAVYPDFHNSYIDAFLIVPSGFVTSIFPWVWINNEGAAMISWLSSIEYVVFGMLLPVALPTYTLIQLFRHSGFAAWEVWISAILTSFFVVIAFATAISVMRGAEDSET